MTQIDAKNKKINKKTFSPTPPFNTLCGLGSEFDKNTAELSGFEQFLLVGSPFLTLITNIFGTLAYINYGKNGQLGLKAQVVLGLSLLLQLMARLAIMIPTVLAGLPGRGLESSSARVGLLLVVPMIVHGVTVITLMPTRVTETHDRMTHIIANIWFVIPARTPENRNQVSKGQELTWMNLLVGLNLTITGVVTACLMDPEAKLMMPSLNMTAGMEFGLLFVLPALLCHLASCLVLGMHYVCKEEGCYSGCCCWCRSLGRLCSPEEAIQVELPDSQVRLGVGGDLG